VLLSPQKETAVDCSMRCFIESIGTAGKKTWLAKLKAKMVTRPVLEKISWHSLRVSSQTLADHFVMAMMPVKFQCALTKKKKHNLHVW